MAHSCAVNGRRLNVHDHEHDHHDQDITRRQIISSGASLGAAMMLPGSTWASTPATAADMAKAGAAWLGLLSDSQRRAAQLTWDNRARRDWHYVPRSRPGVALREMTPPQAAAAWDLLGTLLSARGLDQVRGQLQIERVLGEMTGSLRFRDPGNYALAIFGDPRGTAPWAWRFEGHHLSLSVVVGPEHGVAVTPMFFGANPARVPRGHTHAGFRLVGAEEDAAFGLIRSLEGSVRQQAVIGDRSLGDIVSGPGRELSLRHYEGIAVSGLSGAQQSGVMQIMQLYASTMRDEIATAVMRRLREAGSDTLHFAWAGSLEPGRPHYFRIHGPTALIEYDNTQDGANHVHSVWIDPQDVFGSDMLQKHYRNAH
jgi:hypothetical protein